MELSTVNRDDGAEIPLLPVVQKSWWRTAVMQSCLGYWNSGLACLMTAPFLFFASNFSAFILLNSLPLMEIILLRSLPVVILVLFFRDWRYGICENEQKSVLKCTVLHTAVAVVSRIAGSAAIAMLPLADALTLIYMNVGVTAFCSWLFRIDKIKFSCCTSADLCLTSGSRGYGFVGVGSCLLGLVFVIQPTIIFPDGKAQTRERWFGLLAGIVACLSASVGILLKRVIGTAQPPDLLFIYASIALLPFSFFSLAIGFPSSPRYTVHLWQWGLLAIHALGSFAANVLINRGIVLLSSTLGSLSASFQIILAHFSDVFFMKEHFSLFALSGTLLVIGGGVVTVMAIDDDNDAD